MAYQVPEANILVPKSIFQEVISWMETNMAVPCQVELVFCRNTSSTASLVQIAQVFENFEIRVPFDLDFDSRHSKVHCH